MRTVKNKLKKAQRRSVHAEGQINAVQLSENPIKAKKKNRLFIKLLAITGIIALAYFFRGLFFAAFVGLNPIPRYALIKTLEDRYGAQVLEEMVSRKIITNEARSMNISVSKSEVDDEIGNIKSMLEAQGGTLEEALSTQGQSLSELEENIYTQKVVEKILADKINVSESEAKEYFEKNISTFPEGSSFEDVKDELTSSLRQQKLGAEFEKWINEKKSASKIKYFVNL